MSVSHGFDVWVAAAMGDDFDMKFTICLPTQFVIAHEVEPFECFVMFPMDNCDEMWVLCLLHLHVPSSPSRSLTIIRAILNFLTATFNKSPDEQFN